MIYEKSVEANRLNVILCHRGKINIMLRNQGISYLIISK